MLIYLYYTWYWLISIFHLTHHCYIHLNNENKKPLSTVMNYLLLLQQRRIQQMLTNSCSDSSDTCHAPRLFEGKCRDYLLENMWPKLGLNFVNINRGMWCFTLSQLPHFSPDYRVILTQIFCRPPCTHTETDFTVFDWTYQHCSETFWITYLSMKEHFNLIIIILTCLTYIPGTSRNIIWKRPP